MSEAQQEEGVVRNRVIGGAEGQQAGPLLIIVGAVHGNEPAGVLALEATIRRLRDKGLPHHGTLLGLIGNLGAFRQNVRYVDRDLNRYFLPERMQADRTSAEAGEAAELLTTISAAIDRFNPTELILLDIHTTTADGGDFATTIPDEASCDLAKQLGVPVVFGLTDVLHGTLVSHFTTERVGLPTRAFAYEAGQHTARASADRAESLVWALLGELGMVDTAPVGAAIASDTRPRLTRIVFRLAIPPDSAFSMLPGFGNFDPIQAGQPLAYLDGETVTSEYTGYMLMPLYQAQGEDGYFLVEEVKA